MKHIFTHSFILLLVGVFCLNLNAQNTDNTAKDYRLDYSVPDQPAFNVLNYTPSDILRPSTVNEISVAVSNFFDGKNATLPRSFGMEIAPFLIAKNKATLADYRKNYLWTNLRFSLGTGVDTTNSQDKRSASIGFRWTPIDKSDLRLNKNLNLAITTNLISIGRALTDLRIGIAKKYHIKVDEIDNNVDAKREFERDSTQIVDMASKSITDLKKEYKAKMWNALKFDMAGAILISSPDSLVKNSSFRGGATWATLSFPFTKVGQGVLGFNYKGLSYDSVWHQTDSLFSYIDTLSLPNDSVFTSFDSLHTQTVSAKTFSAGFRLYLGANRIKGYVEGNYRYNFDRKMHQGSFLMGMEVNVWSSIWVNFNVNFTATKTPEAKWAKNWYPSLDFKWQIPENFKLL